MPLLPLSSFRLPFRLLLIVSLFALMQSLRRLLPADFWLDAAMQALAAPLLFYAIVGWQLRREYISQSIRAVPIGIVAGLLVFSLMQLLVLSLNAQGSEKELRHSAIQIVLIIPLIEEIFFRLVLAGALLQAGLAQLWTIVLSGLFFALSHDYSVAPFLFPVGLAAGWLFLRFGVIASLSMHVVYNLAILLHAIS